MNKKIGQIVGVLALALLLSSPMRNVHLNAIDSEIETPQTQTQHPEFQKVNRLKKVEPEEFLRKLTRNPPMRFAASASAFQPHESCKRSAAELSDSFRVSMDEAKLNVSEFVPESGFIVDLNFYFKYRSHYFQLSLQPVARGARKYQLSLIRSPDPRFSTTVEKLSSPLNQSLPTILTHEEAIRGLRDLIQEYTDQGARWGSRSVLVSESPVMFEEKSDSTPQKIPTRVEFHDGRVHGFMNHQQECHVAENETLECMCW